MRSLLPPVIQGLSTIKAATLSFVLVTFIVSSAVMADDTDVYFSALKYDASAQSNVLFILDNSGSMRDPIDAGGQSKISMLKTAMHTLLDDITDINVGIMEFGYCGGTHAGTHGFKCGWGILDHPVTDIAQAGTRAALKATVSGLQAETGTPLVGSLFEAAKVMVGGPKSSFNGGPAYPGSMIGECQHNHIVMLSDGEAWGPSDTGAIKSFIGESSCSGAADEECGVDLATWLYDTDHMVDPENRHNNIRVHTIQFAINSPFLDQLAEAGGGSSKKADSFEELEAAFTEILKEVADVDTTIVAPSVSIDQNNRLSQSTDLYFSLFKPTVYSMWHGNLKKYKLGFDSVTRDIEIQDRRGSAAIDPETGGFHEDVSDFWNNSTEPDGATVVEGGAANKLPGQTARNIYTFNNPEGSRISFKEENITAAMLGNPSVQISKLIKWARGEDNTQRPDIETPPTGGNRKHMGDALHSTPVTANYASGSLVFVGTNEGFLHAINASDNNGTEEFAIIPKDLLPNLQDFYKNDKGTPHPYGLDGDLVLRHEDTNHNQLIDRDETAILYVGMRRGGNKYYAYDVSKKNNPEFLWEIEGGVPGAFSRLGQTWSKPISTKVRYQGVVRDVLIFGGGYDANQDPDNPKTTAVPNMVDGVGNSVFIVDADSGKHIWSATPGSGDFGDMDYSIPSDLRVIDINSDGIADRIYVGDMGGQLWRLDINSHHVSGQWFVRAGVMAELGDTANPGGRSSHAGNDTRRFYAEPDVALVNHKGKRFMTVSLGSGWRANPLSKSTDDRFYMIRDNNALNIPEPGEYGKKTGSTWAPFEESDLDNVTGTISDSSDPVENGWMLELVDDGEKVLGRSVTINNQVVFTSYSPITPTDPCAPGTGHSYAYALNLLNGNPAVSLTTGVNTQENLTNADRREWIKGEGIPPPPTTVLVNDNGTTKMANFSGARRIVKPVGPGELTLRTYWQDKGRGMTPEEAQNLE